MNAMVNTTKQIVAIIPARYASTRFPGKPLADIGGKSMIQRVYEQSRLALDHVYVATDDERIFNTVKNFNGQVVMTSPRHNSGTNRCEEAVNLVEAESGMNFDVVLNIQGDEPFLHPQQLELLVSCFGDPEVEIATLAKRIKDSVNLLDPNRPKVVINLSGDALYFSRTPIPSLRSHDAAVRFTEFPYYMHIGLYGYRKDVLSRIARLPQSHLELAETLEQLRWIENGYRVAVRITELESMGIDTPEDLEQARRMVRGRD